MIPFLALVLGCLVCGAAVGWSAKALQVQRAKDAAEAERDAEWDREHRVGVRPIVSMAVPPPRRSSAPRTPRW